MGLLCLESRIYWHSEPVVKVYKAELGQMLEPRLLMGLFYKEMERWKIHREPWRLEAAKK